MGVPQYARVRVEPIICANDQCNVTIYLPDDLISKLRDNHKTFYCYNGHTNYFPQQSDTEKLKADLEKMTGFRDNANKRLEWKEQELKQEKASKIALKGVVTRTKNRVKNGVCPCCNRSFVNLAQHMAGQHPNYGNKE